MTSEVSQRLRRRIQPSLLLGLGGIFFALIIWEAFARSGMFSLALTPPIASIASRLGEITLDGAIFVHTATTLLRVLVGMGISILIAIPLGMLMGTSRPTEKMFSPLLSVLMPIPSLAWVPLFVLWFGIGNLSTILVIIYASVFTMTYNTWVGVRAINQVWIKSATVMGANQWQLFSKVILPGTLPYIISGLRIAFGRAWIAVIGGELLASPDWGLGKIIFDASEFLDTESMLSALIFIGIIGIAIEKLFLRRLERSTIDRWGMAQGHNN
ncbi:MAG: ABC transporter permease [Burkholderiales bacterium]|jgi:NitT/TauT family transport system permease protein|nr:ABC transporter permease [Burkholderiales bacterium]